MAFVTRFAPSPTGPLHLGHAFSALTAFDQAQAVGGRFLLRIEDTDTDRCRPAWEAQIFDDLQWLDLRWESPVLRQSDHVQRYNNALDQLAELGLLYPCTCTRADIRAATSAPQEGTAQTPVYPGTCRHRKMSDKNPGDALRLNLQAAVKSYEEKTAKSNFPIEPQQLMQNHGDVVLGRKDIGTIAYVLASVVDDAAQGITNVIRGEDLLEITQVQMLLQNLLGYPTPHYHHHRLIRDETGKRLAKRDDARALTKYRSEGATPADIRRMVGL